MARYQIADQLGSFRVGDEPGVIVVEIESDGQPVTLDTVTAVAGTLGDPGIPVVTVRDGDTIKVTLPALADAGVTYLQLELTIAAATVAVDPSPLVVEQSDGWHSLGTARAEWRDAPMLDVQLYTVLEVAKAQCLAYAPPLVDDAGAPLPVPFTWRQAELMQARNVWNSSKTDPATGGIGSDEFVIRPYPMDQTIRLILRPKRAMGAIA